MALKILKMSVSLEYLSINLLTIKPTTYHLTSFHYKNSIMYLREISMLLWEKVKRMHMTTIMVSIS